MRDRLALLVALLLAVVALVVGSVALGRNADPTRTTIYRPSTPLVIRNVEVVADTVALHGDVLLTITACNSARQVTAYESLTWTGGLVPQTVYANVPRVWPHGCTPMPSRVPVELAAQRYRLVVTEQFNGIIVSGVSPQITVSQPTNQGSN